MSADPPAVAPLPDAAYALLAAEGFDRDVFNPRQHRACELTERYALHLAIALVDRLGLTGLLRTPHTVDALLAARGFVPRFARPLTWILARLRREGLVDAGHRLSAPLPASDTDALHAAILAEEPSYAPALTILDEAAALYPAVARGEIQGERALFQKVGLWVAYFDNANGYYGLNNVVAAHAAAARVPPQAAVLEVGAGLGSATAALLERLAATGRLDRLAGYRATEPVAFFRRRAERTLQAAWPAAPLAFAALDLNEPWEAQGIGAATLDVVWGVNVFHLARDLDAVLRAAHASLRPGGALVVGEGIRPGPDVPVGAELPFQILDAFVDVALDPVTRPMPGFLAAEHWRGAFARAGFTDVTLVPDVERLQALHRGFYAAAVCGRRA